MARSVVLHLSAIVAILLSKGDSARILLVSPSPSYSHQIIYQPIWKELALRGHDVVVITTEPINEPSIKNLREIDISDVYDIRRKKVMEFSTAGSSFIEALSIMVEVQIQVLEKELSHPEVQALIKNETEYFDLVMIEYLMAPMFAFKERFNCPFIGISSMEIGGFRHGILGNPHHAVAYPEYIFGFSDDLTFFQRMLSVLGLQLLSHYWQWSIMAREDAIIETYFGSGYSNTDELSRMVDMVFINSNPVFYQIRPITPATVMISGGIHIKEQKPLPEDLQSFFDNSTNGVIYLSFGSNVRSKDILPEMKKTLLNVFSELPYDVLWKYEEAELPDKPTNVKIVKWAPQQDILRQSKVKLFITQAGLQSLEEALFNQVPMIGIPFYGDQHFNAKKILSKGLGLIVDKYKTMTAEDLKAKILEVITNPKYKERVIKLSNIMKDEPMNALEKAVWWTEYVLRHGGAQHLKGKTIPDYQFYYIDVIAFLFSVTLIFLTVSYVLLKKFLLCIFRKKIKIE